MTEKQMPKYKCHKEVWAFKIKQIVPTVMIDEDGAKETGKIMIFPEEEGYQPFEVSKDFIEKHKPQVGGYYVQYKDGYESYSPADAFEEGYSKIEEEKSESNKGCVSCKFTIEDLKKAFEDGRKYTTDIFHEEHWYFDHYNFKSWYSENYT